MSTLLHTPHGLRPWALRLARWLLAALLLATLAPGISRALSAAAVVPPDARSDGHWVALCTSEGTQWVPLDPAQARTGSGVPDPQALDRCDHCTLVAERFAPLIPDAPALPVVAGHPPAPGFADWPGVGAPARPAQARGPPLLG